MIEVPLNSSPEQIFSITIGEDTYDCRVVLSSRTGIWTISFSQGGIDLIMGVSLLGGIDIMKQYNLPIKNMYMVNLETSNLDPSKEDLGISSKLFILTDEEVVGG